MKNKRLYTLIMLLFLDFALWAQGPDQPVAEKPKSVSAGAFGGGGYGIGYRVFLSKRIAVEGVLLPPITFSDIDNAVACLGVRGQWFFSEEKYFKPYVYLGTSAIFSISRTPSYEAGYGGGVELNYSRFFVDVSVGDVMFLRTSSPEDELHVRFPIPGLSFGFYF